MPGEQQYICIIIAVIFVIATGTTALVLSQAASDTSDSSTSSSFGIKDYHVHSDSSANVVLIVLDDAGWADFSHHNTDPYSALHTPNLDAILSEGLSFANFYTQALCTPARGSMMTGRWTWALGLQHLSVFRTCTNNRLSWDIPTWAEILKEKDYKNFFYGKWHLGMDSWNSTAMGRGWDGFLGPLNSDNESGGGAQNGKGVWVTLNQNWDCDLSLADQVISVKSNTECMFRSYDYRYVYFNMEFSQCYAFSNTTIETACTGINTQDYNDTYLEREGSYLHLDLGENFVDWWRDYSPADPYFTKRSDVILTEEALVRLEELSSKSVEKWSIVLSYKTPHQDPAYLPNGTNTAVVAACERFFNESSVYYSYDRGAICQQMYEIDLEVGSIVTALKHLSLWDNTLVMLTNDNGASSGQYVNATGSDLDYNYGLNWPLRGVKNSYYQGAVKTIMGITGGALPNVYRGVVNTDLHHMADVTPTILAAAGLSEEDMSGISNGEDFDGIPLYSTSKASSGSHEYIYLSAPSSTGSSKWDANISAIVLESGLKYVSVGEGEELNAYGYWGTLPTSKTVESTWETCKDGCVWNLVEDPGEHFDLGGSWDQKPFTNILEKAMTSSSWNEGLQFDLASCEDCSCFSNCEDDSAVFYYGYRYYSPWL